MKFSQIGRKVLRRWIEESVLTRIETCSSVVWGARHEYILVFLPQDGQVRGGAVVLSNRITQERLTASARHAEDLLIFYFGAPDQVHAIIREKGRHLTNARCVSVFSDHRALVAAMTE